MLRSSDTTLIGHCRSTNAFETSGLPWAGYLIEEITQLLMKEETSRVCILGPGGMGKTSVSLGVIEKPLIKARFLPENRIWVPCIEATSAILLLEILYNQVQVPGNKQVTIEKVISVLDTSDAAPSDPARQLRDTLQCD
jgi:hypothetical protein